MPLHVWTVDLGNSGGSLARTVLVRPGDGPEAPRPSRRGGPEVSALARATRLASWRLTEDGDDLEAVRFALDSALGTASRAGEPRAEERGAISSVGRPERELALERALIDRRIPVRLQPPAGLVLRIDHPETCGLDRQYAMRAALEELGSDPASRAALVVDAGTALTVDAGCVEPDGTPLFLGGAIAPGPRTSALALSEAGARLPLFDIEPDVAALGRSTVHALRSGIAVGFRGAVAELASSIATEAFGGHCGVRVFLTGGAREFARSALERLFGNGVCERPELVHSGLAWAATDPRGPLVAGSAE